MAQKKRRQIGRFITLLVVLFTALITIKPAVPILIWPKTCTYTERTVLSLEGGVAYERKWTLTRDEARRLSSVFRGKWFVRKDLTEAGGFAFSPEHAFTFIFPFCFTQTFLYDDFKHHLVEIAFPGSFRTLTDEERTEINDILKSVSEDKLRMPEYTSYMLEDATGKLVWDMNSLFVIQTENGYEVIFGEIWEYPDKIGFDEFVTFVSGGTKAPVNANRIDHKVLGAISSKEEMFAVLGQPMAYIGSETKNPTYIMDDGQILYFTLFAEQVDEYTIVDITDFES